jgi:CRISPR-associated protein Cas1
MDAKTMCVSLPGGPLQRFPLSLVERVIVIGRPTVSCDVWRALSEHNIPALLLPGRGSGAVAHIGPWPSSSASIRLAQFREIVEERAITTCRWLIQAKLSGQQKIVLERISERPELYPLIDQLEEAKRRVSGMRDRNSLMGVEGAAATAYFQAIGRIIDPRWGFSGRNRRPPRDPANTLLSLSYTLGASEMRREILIAGLDPAIGFLHANQANREGLTLDLLEPLRPMIDGFVLGLLSGKLTLRNFVTNDQDGCLLNKEGRGRFFKEWVAWLANEGGNGHCNPRTMAVEVVSSLLQRINAR